MRSIAVPHAGYSRRSDVAGVSDKPYLEESLFGPLLLSAADSMRDQRVGRDDELGFLLDSGANDVIEIEVKLVELA